MATYLYTISISGKRVADAAAGCGSLPQALDLLKRRFEAPLGDGPDYLTAALLKHVDVCCFTIQAACHPVTQGGRA